MAGSDRARRASIACPPGEDEREAEGGEDAADVGHGSGQGAFAVLDRSSPHRRDSATASVIHTPDFRWRGNERRRRRRLLPFSIQVSNSRRHAPRRTKASAIAPVVWEARGEPASLFPSPHGGAVPPAKSTGDGAPGGRQGLAKPPWAGLTHPPARLARARARLAKRAAPSRRSTVEPARFAPARPAARIVGAPALGPRGGRPRDDARGLTEARG